MRAAIYARVSTDDQEKEGTSLQSQTEACINKAKELGLEVPETYLFRETFSGLTDERPQLAALRKLAKSDELKAVIVYSPDRLSRKGEDILAIVKEFTVLGVKITFVNMQFEDNITGKLLGFVLGWSSEFEAAQIKERTMRGKKILVNRGMLPQGTGIGIYGYTWDKTLKRRIPHPFESKVVEKIFTMFADGYSFCKIAERLNQENITSKAGKKWHPRTIRRIIHNEAYIGRTYFGKTKRTTRTKVQNVSSEHWILLPDITPPIINHDLFERTQNALNLPRARTGKALHEYLLTGHLKCGICNSPMVGSCLSKKYRYYSCRGKSSTPYRERICNSSYIKADEVESLVWHKIRPLFENPDNIVAELKKQAIRNTNNTFDSQKSEAEINKIRRRLKTYEVEERRLVSLFRHKDISEDYILDEINKLKNERSIDMEQLTLQQDIKNREIGLNKAEIKLEVFQQMIKKNLYQFTIADKREILNALSINIMVTNGEIDIKGVIPKDLITIGQTSA
jgi:site-specific DNA recombinase